MLGPSFLSQVHGTTLMTPTGGYLRISVVSPTLPADVEGNVPETCTELVFTLNVIVYGVGRDLLEQITWDTAVYLSKRKGG